MANVIKTENKVLEKGIHNITSDYKSRNKARPNHNGIDFVSRANNINRTDYIVAIEKGKIAEVAYDDSRGYYVNIKHDSGLISVYYHMKKDTIAIKKGQLIGKGQRIGYMGSTGRSTGAHLHFGILDGKTAVDPLPYLTGEKSINDKKDDTIDEDGIWGPSTTKKAQKVFGTPVDGKVSNQYTAYKASNPGLLSSTFEWKVKPNKKGSVLIKVIQEMVGATVDGFVGPNFIEALQKYFGTPVDGKVSKPSVVVKAFQKYLNTK